MSAQPTPDLTPLYDAALPADAPGAWIREAIEQLRADGGAVAS